MKQERLAELKALTEAATPGPWKYDGIMFIQDPDTSMVCEIRGYGADLPMDDNAAFIAAARTALPELIAEIERLQGVVKKAHGDIIKHHSSSISRISPGTECPICKPKDSGVWQSLEVLQNA